MREIEKLEDWVTYVPDVDGNRDDEDPLTVDIHPMTAEEWRAAQRGIVTDKAKRMIVRSQKAVGRILAERVRNIHGYKVGGRQITNGSELYQYGEAVVYDDVFEAITNLSTLTEGLLGKLKSRSVSSAAGTATPGGGAALGAAVRSAPTSLRPSVAEPVIVTAEVQQSPSSGLLSSSDAPGLS